MLLSRRVHDVFRQATKLTAFAFDIAACSGRETGVVGEEGVVDRFRLRSMEEAIGPFLFDDIAGDGRIERVTRPAGGGYRGSPQKSTID